MNAVLTAIVTAFLALASVSAAIEVSGTSASGWTLGRDGESPIISSWRPMMMLSSGLKLDTQVKAVAHGLDIEWTVTNSSHRDAQLPGLPLPTLNLGSEIVAMDFYRSGWPQRLTQDGPNTRMQGVYPGTLYSPVAVAMTTRIAVGVTVQYPVLEYQHECSLAIVAAGDDAWSLELIFAGRLADSVGSIRRPATVPAGATRTWKATIRATAKPLEWLDTLEPYRSYFLSKYGGVTYTRNTKPIRGMILAFSKRQSQDNPSGWIEAANRPDQNGYASVVSLLQQSFAQAERSILWAPTGRALDNQTLNLPFRFTSHWTSDGPNSPMSDAPRLLREVATSPQRQWGLWWGHSMQTTSAWDTPPQKVLNPHDPAQVAVAMGELRGALDAGATIIGLDAFTTGLAGEWDRLTWLQMLKKAAPDASFCVEGLCSDILHRLAPTWIDLYRANPDRFGGELMIRGRFILADWLLPGHETWAGMLFDRSTDPAVHAAAANAAQARMTVVRSVAYDGYVPVVFADLPVRNVIVSGTGEPTGLDATGSNASSAASTAR